jgi:DNA repair exonuclease SbcCD ATPase subunit
MPGWGAEGEMPDEQNQDQQDDQQQEQQQDTNVDGLKTALQAEREARKQLEKDLKAIRTELSTVKNGSKTEAERLQALEAEKGELSRKLRERDARDTVLDAARKAGASDPTVVYRYLKSDLDIDDDGEVKNLKTLIDDAKTTAPQLFRAATGKADAAAGKESQPKPTGMTALIRQAAGRG